MVAMLLPVKTFFTFCGHLIFDFHHGYRMQIDTADVFLSGKRISMLVWKHWGIKVNSGLFLLLFKEDFVPHERHETSYWWVTAPSLYRGNTLLEIQSLGSWRANSEPADNHCRRASKVILNSPDAKQNRHFTEIYYKSWGMGSVIHSFFWVASWI